MPIYIDHDKKPRRKAPGTQECTPITSGSLIPSRKKSLLNLIRHRPTKTFWQQF